MYDPGEYVGLIYRDRMRSLRDKTSLSALYRSAFGQDLYTTCGELSISAEHIQIGHSFLRRNVTVSMGKTAVKKDLVMLHRILAPLESLMKCFEMNWMAILVSRGVPAF